MYTLLILYHPDHDHLFITVCLFRHQRHLVQPIANFSLHPPQHPILTHQRGCTRLCRPPGEILTAAQRILIAEERLKLICPARGSNTWFAYLSRMHAAQISHPPLTLYLSPSHAGSAAMHSRTFSASAVLCIYSPALALNFSSPSWVSTPDYQKICFTRAQWNFNVSTYTPPTPSPPDIYPRGGCIRIHYVESHLLSDEKNLHNKKFFILI